MGNWLSIDSECWHLRYVGTGTVFVTQRASGVVRTCSRGKLPSDETLALMSEYSFNKICREVFHGER
jgi:hypothetical protein